MKIYRSLQLTTPQMQQLTALWRSWCRRRAALSYKLSTSVRGLLGILPTKSMLPMHILQPFFLDETQHKDEIDHACTLKQRHQQRSPPSGGQGVQGGASRSVHL